MKKTQLLDAFRNIRKQGVSFLSVVVIAMLAVMTYLGIAYAADATARSASDYFAEHRMWDLEVVSTLLMDDEDLAAIRAEDGNARYEYFFPMEDPETVLLIDQWRDQAAIDAHHASPMMARIAALREKYDLHMKVERFASDDSGLPEKDLKFIKK